MKTRTLPMTEGVNLYHNKWKVMAAVAMGIFLATIDSSIVNVALPTLVNVLNTHFATVQWVVLAYLLTVTTLMLGMGRLGDMIGKKPVFTTGLLVFTAGSVLCGLASTVYALIGFRVIQALGAAMIMALGTAIVTEAFPAEERGRALGIAGLMVSLGVIAGPTAGGIILQSLSWHWIFFVNLPVGIIGLLVVLRYVPNPRPKGGQRFDWLGALFLFGALACLLFALTLGQDLGFTETRVLWLFAASAVLLAAFIAIELRVRDPMIDLRLFRVGLFSLNLFTGLLAFICSAGVILLMPFYQENVLGYTPRQVGLMMAVIPVAAGIAAPIAGALSDRFGTRRLTVAGLATLVLGYLAVSTLSETTTTLGYILRFLPVGIGIGLFQSPNNSAVMGAAPRDRLGVASGLLSVTRTLGQTTGIATLGAYWASQVSRRAGAALAGGVTSAPPAVQVAALHATLRVILVLIGVSFLLSVWALLKETRRA